MDEFDQTKEQAIARAAANEKLLGRPIYVVRLALTDAYTQTETIPTLGEWYTSDGVRHG